MLRSALNTVIQTVFFYSWLCMTSKRGDIPNMVISGTNGTANQKKVIPKGGGTRTTSVRQKMN